MQNERARLTGKRDAAREARDTEIQALTEKLHLEERRARDLRVALEAQLSDRDRQIARLVGWIETLETGISDLLRSRRWRVGNVVAHVLRSILFQPQVPTAADGLQQRLRQFHAWDRDRTETAREHATRHRDSAGHLRRVLYLLHAGAGGTPETSLDLIHGLHTRYQAYVLTSNGVRLRLFEVVGRERRNLEQWELERPWQITDMSRPDYRTILTDVLGRYDIDLVHIRHLMGHALDAPQLCQDAGVPVVVSFHDFYFVCPTIHLLDNHDRYCAGVCTPGMGTCRIPTGRMGSVPSLKHAWVHEWQRRVASALAHAAAFVTTSEHTREVYRSIYPQWDVPFHVIEHGRDLPQRRLGSRPHRGQPIRILAPGNIGVNKGAGLLRDLKACDRDGRLELHFLGDRSHLLDGVGVDHGLYERDELADRVAAIAPSFIAIFSIWPETYCHTLTEAWSCGVPVLASDIGALRERLSLHGGGWLVDYTDPERLYRQILGIADDPEGYEHQAARATLREIRSVADMARDYDRLYRPLVTGKRRPRAEDAQVPLHGG